MAKKKSGKSKKATTKRKPAKRAKTKVKTAASRKPVKRVKPKAAAKKKAARTITKPKEVAFPAPEIQHEMPGQVSGEPMGGTDTSTPGSDTDV